jgi:hypothetical protein
MDLAAPAGYSLVRSSHQVALMTSLFSLIYASDASADFREHQIPELLKSIRPANAKRGITGMLIFNQHSFLQVLEGDAGAVQGLYAHIAADPRHSQVSCLAREPIESRSFSDWYMDYATVDACDVPAFGDAGAGERRSFVALSGAAAKGLIARLSRPSWQKTAHSTRTRVRAG